MAADRGPRAGGPGLSKKQTRTHCTEPNAQLTTLQKRFGESKYPTTSGRSPSWIASLPNIWLRGHGGLVTGSCHRAPLESAHRTGTGQVGLRKGRSHLGFSEGFTFHPSRAPRGAFDPLHYYYVSCALAPDVFNFAYVRIPLGRPGALAGSSTGPGGSPGEPEEGFGVFGGVPASLSGSINGRTGLQICRQRKATLHGGRGA